MITDQKKNKSQKLRPSLWRTCRVVAHPVRLQLLWHLLNSGELSVSELVERTGATQPNASNQLRSLNSRGLITYRRERMNVIYRAEANHAVAYAPELLAALRAGYRQSMDVEIIIRQATGFTHERRVEIVRALKGNPNPFGVLHTDTGISPAALSRHLDKLMVRGFIRRTDGMYRLRWPDNPLGHTLLKIALA